MEVLSVFPCQLLMPFFHAFPLKFSTIYTHFWPFFFLKYLLNSELPNHEWDKHSIIFKTQKITAGQLQLVWFDWRKQHRYAWTTENKFGVGIMLCFQFLMQVHGFSRYVMAFMYLCTSTDININVILTHTPNVNDNFVNTLFPFL